MSVKSGDLPQPGAPETTSPDEAYKQALKSLKVS